MDFDKEKFAGQRFTAMCPAASPKMKAGDRGQGRRVPHHPVDLFRRSPGRNHRYQLGGLVTVQVNPVGAVHAGSVGKGKALSMSVVGPAGTEALNQIYQ